MVHYERALYDGSPADLLELAQSAEPEYRTVLIIGHNPTISQLSELLDASSEADSDGLRTCGIAVHQVEGEWSTLEKAPIVAAHTARA